MNEDVRGAEMCAIVAERRRRSQKLKTEYTLENNALADLIRQQKIARIEEEKRAVQKEADDMAEMERMLEAAGILLAAIGRPVLSFFINPGGEVIVAVRKNESVRIRCGGIADQQARRIAVCKIIDAVAGY